jgi:integrase
MKIPYVTWRNGRPRFEPSPTLRNKGHRPHDLKNPDGSWYTAGQCLDFSHAFSARLNEERAAARLAQKPGAARPKATRPDRLIPVAVRLSGRSYTVADLMREWLGSPAVLNRKPSTIRDYRQKARVIEDHYRDIWLSECAAVTRPVIFGLHDRMMMAQGRHTALAVVRLISNAYTWALNRGKIPDLQSNPAQKLKLETPAPRVRFAEIAEVDALVATADRLGRPEIGDLIMLGVWTGQRQGDRLQLQLVSIEDGRLRLKQAKTGALVNMPLAPELRKRLEASQARRQAAGKILPWIAVDERVWRPFLGDYYRHVFGDIRKAAATIMPSVASLRDQDLRDTAVTWLALAGCTIWEICAITGHEFQTAMAILRHYLAVHPDMATEAIRKLVEWYDAKKAPTP